MTTPSPRDNSGDFEDAAELARRADRVAQLHMDGRCGCKIKAVCESRMRAAQEEAAARRNDAARGEHPPKF